MNKNRFSRLLIVAFAMSMMISCGNEAISSSSIDTGIAVQSKEVVNLDVATFKTKMQEHPGTLLDVRTPEEWANGTISGAKKINYFDTDFEDQVAVFDHDKPIYVYCKSGGRSTKASVLILKEGFSEVYNLLGGITAWQSAGNEVSK